MNTTGMIGHVDHGKTNLTAAIAYTAALESQGDPLAVIDQENKRVIALRDLPEVVVQNLRDRGFEVILVETASELKNIFRQSKPFEEQVMDILEEAVPGIRALITSSRKQAKEKTGNVPADLAEKRRKIEMRRQERWDKQRK